MESVNPLIKIAEVFINYYKEKGLAEFIRKCGWFPPMPLKEFKRRVGNTKNMDSWGQAIYMIADWVYPSYDTQIRIMKIMKER